MNCVCNMDACKNCNDQLISRSYLDSTSGEITLESYDGTNATLNRRTIPVSILLPSSNSSNQLTQMGNQTNLMGTSINSPLACAHLSPFSNQQNSTICNSIDQSSNTSVDQTTTTNSEQNSSTNRVFFIRASNEETDFIQTNSLRSNQLNQFNSNHLNSSLLRSKVQITDSGYNDKTEQNTNQMLYLTNQPNQDQYDYYKLLNRTSMFDDPYVAEANYLNYNGLELLTNPYLHDQVANLNNNEQINGKVHLDEFNKELSISSNVELLDGNAIESNQSKTVSF